MSIDERLSIRAAADAQAEGVALIDEHGALTFGALAREVAQRSARLERDRVVAIDGSPERDRVIDVLAAIEIGAPVAMLHPRWPAGERARVLAAVDAAPRCPGALAILHTSGTSGTPRGVILSRRAFVASAACSAQLLPLEPGADRWLLCMPTAHVGGLSIVTRSLIARSTIVIAGPFDADRTLRTLARHRPTVLSLVPTMLARLLDAGLAPWSELRAILLGGAACPRRVLDRAIAAGLPIRTTYGLTEACSQVTTARADVRSIDEGAGEPLPGIEVRIGARGTIEVRGPTMLDGFYPPSLDTGAPLDDQGFYDTGDIGELDARGRLHVHARRTDLIVTGGENVAPAMVEAALERIAGIEAACVFGLEDESWGQVVAAAIVAAPDRPTDREVTDALRRELAPFAIPRRIARVDAIAIAASGKIDRAATADAARNALRDLAR